MRIAAVIFDMDGLMLDTERVYSEVFARAAADCAVEFPQSLHLELLGRNTQDTRALLLERWGGDAAMLDRFMDCCRAHHEVCFARPLAVKQGLLELLDFLEHRAVPKVVATSTRRSHAIPRLQGANLLHRFLSVTTGDQVQRGKPAPDIFLLAASTINVPPTQCVVLEDSEAGVTGAHAAGMAAIMVPDMKQPSDDVRARAHAVHESLVQVKAFLAQMLEGPDRV